jgi:hypothetical protein
MGKEPGDRPDSEQKTGDSPSTSEPHPSQDPEAEPSEAPERDKLDD